MAGGAGEGITGVLSKPQCRRCRRPVDGQRPGDVLLERHRHTRRAAADGRNQDGVDAAHRQVRNPAAVARCVPGYRAGQGRRRYPRGAVGFINRHQEVCTGCAEAQPTDAQA